MKKNIQESLTLLSGNRYLLVLCIAQVLLALSFVIYVGLNVRPSELQLVSHCSAFGFTHLYRDQWFYLLNFGIFGLLACVIQVSLTVKLFTIKGASLAISFAWLGIVMILLAWATTYPVLNVLSSNSQDCRVTSAQ